MDVFKIKKNDTSPALSVTLEYANGSPIDLTGGSVWFNLGDISTYATFGSGQAVITGSTDGMCEYRWVGSSTAIIDTGSVRKCWGEFEFQCAGSRMTLPADHSLKIEIFEDYN